MSPRRNWDSPNPSPAHYLHYLMSTTSFSRLDNDIALLHLSKDVIFTENIVPACLPTDASNTYTGQLATVSGTISSIL